ncbi:helix-turn-helix domain-containing protein [Halorientalis sp. IM1011]|uniref:helix-turn-helix domain-containing protein n=1 Tax=Halorientalis sp. IM1011 TaxID=1932360 RepID=UPI0020A2AAC8|nr:helix-turn-helix domain-containing protein [Halorientalis sp. IM1011]
MSEIGHGSVQQVPIHEVAERLDWSESYASRVISALQERGYANVERKKNTKFVSMTDIQPVELLTTLISEFGHVDFPELLAGAGLQILYYLDEPRTASELTERSHVSRGTVYRRLEKLQHVGIVGKDHSQYALTEPFSDLSDLARAVFHHDHRQEALAEATKVTIHWETHDEYLFGSDTDTMEADFHRTGPTVFAEFGIPLLTRGRFHYIHSERLSEVTAADLVCHMLLINQETRFRIYCMLLIAHQEIDSKALNERARYYDREAEIDLSTLTSGLLAYLDSQGEQTTERLPEWREFKRTAADYDIRL